MQDGCHPVRFHHLLSPFFFPALRLGFSGTVLNGTPLATSTASSCAFNSRFLRHSSDEVVRFAHVIAQGVEFLTSIGVEAEELPVAIANDRAGMGMGDVRNLRRNTNHGGHDGGASRLRSGTRLRCLDVIWLQGQATLASRVA